MKLKCLRLTQPALTLGEEYEISKGPGNWLYQLFDDSPNPIRYPIDCFEKPIDKFLRILPTAAKVVVPRFDNTFRFDLLMTSSYFIIYEHKPESQWSLPGHRYTYYHDGDSGEFIATPTETNQQIISKQRILKADLLKMLSIVTKK